MTAEKFSLAVTGDSLITMRLSVYKDERFMKLVNLIRGADVAFTNLEGTIHDYKGYPSAESGGTYVIAEPVISKEIKWFGFDIVSRANNHAWDYSAGGLLATSKILDEVDLIYAGVGENLAEAREPRYLDTGKVRVALISLCSSYPPSARAGEARRDMKGRPGLNPLRWHYEVDRGIMSQLRDLASKLGMRVPEEKEKLNLFRNKFFLSDKKGVMKVADNSDVEANLRAVKEAKRQADLVLVSFHTHESGEKREKPPEFFQPFAYSCIDAGANAVIGHGSHTLKGIEIYDKKPIFYSLGNFIFENETVRKLPTDIYDRYNLGNEASPADLQDARHEMGWPETKRPWFTSEHWESVAAMCKYNAVGELSRLELHPIVLGLNKPRSRRGRPILATLEEAEKILEKMSSMSSIFGTEIKIENGVGIVKIK